MVAVYYRERVVPLVSSRANHIAEGLVIPRLFPDALRPFDAVEIEVAALGDTGPLAFPLGLFGVVVGTVIDRFPIVVFVDTLEPLAFAGGATLNIAAGLVGFPRFDSTIGTGSHFQGLASGLRAM